MMKRFLKKLYFSSHNITLQTDVVVKDVCLSIANVIVLSVGLPRMTVSRYGDCSPYPS